MKRLLTQNLTHLPLRKKLQHQKQPRLLLLQHPRLLREGAENGALILIEVFID
jgi:hypothetical protein